ncbi:MAG: hypothetical protein OXI63_16065, partial [Candidatus Poribacteria bacterium]|nr:hypothetical protein [Candidatus Poribacteria bacterium]
MKYITNLFGASCVALVAMLFTASGAFAQITYSYVDPISGDGTISDCSDHENPCLLANGITAAGGDTLLVRVRRAGDSVTLAAPSTALGASVQFGAYVRGKEGPVEGTLEFTGNFMIGAGGTFVVHSLATVQFKDVTISDAGATVSVPAVAKETNPGRRLVITGTLTTVNGATLGVLLVAEDLMIKRSGNDAAVLRVDALTVNSGATLTVGTDENPIDLRVPLKKSPKDDLEGILTVNGTIGGTGTVWIAHTLGTDATGRGGLGDDGSVGGEGVNADDDFFHLSSDYIPDDEGNVDHEDCVWITGGGEIKNEIRAIAAGNICVGLAKIGDLTVTGSIGEPTGGATENQDITTDVIFRNEVEVDGNVVQWNDARVVFEKDATVTGSVILDDGGLPNTLTTGTSGNLPFGAAKTRTGTDADPPVGEVVTSVRQGVKLASAAEEDPFTCDYRSTMEAVRVVDTPTVSLSATPMTFAAGTDTDVTVTANFSKPHPDGTEIVVPLTVTPAGSVNQDPLPTITLASGTTDLTTPPTATLTVPASTAAGTITVALGELPTTVRAGAKRSVTITVTSTPENVFVDSDVQFFKTQNTATAGPGFYIPGVQFQGKVMIEGDLDVRSTEITDKPSEMNRNDTRCAPRVIFAAKKVGGANTALMSHIQRDLVIEAEDHNYRILLDVDSTTVKDEKVRSAHNLSVDGDIFATGHPIEMEDAAEAMDNGMCGENMFSLTAGTRLVLSDDDGHVVNGDALTLDALVMLEDLEIEGELTVTTLHVAKDTELESNETVTVNKALILEGELDGELNSDSRLDKLVYGNRRTDLVDAGNPTSLSVHIDDGEFRLDQVTEVANFGLCKGSVVLFEAGTDKENTLTVTNVLTVKDGTLRLDTNEPGSIGADAMTPAAAGDGYILRYVTEEERTASSEWSAHARKVAVDHKDAVIVVDEAKSLVEGVHIINGHLHLKGDDSHLTVGMPSVPDVDPFVMVDNGELHGNGNNVMVHGTVSVATGDNQTGKIVTGGGELHVLGTTDKKLYMDGSAMATIGVRGTIDVGAGALQLGPAYEEPTNGLMGDGRPDVTLTLNKSDKGMGAVTGMIFVPKGSKETRITGEVFDTIVLDATGNAKKDAKGADNWGGGLYFHDTKVVIDSLAAMNDAAVEFYDQADPKTGKYVIEIKKDVELNSGRIYVNGQNELKFGGDLTFGETGGMRVWDEAKVTVMGDFMQNAGSQHPGHQDGVGLAGSNAFTVMGDFMVADGAHRFESNANTDLVLKGDFHFAAVKTGSDKTLAADLEFSGKESQTVSAEVD